jgi:hypothetical protein
MQFKNTISSITYRIPSDSQPGAFHDVAVDPEDGRMTCPCPARGGCWHEKAIRTGLAGKPIVRVSQRPAPDPVRVSISEAGRELADMLQV